MAIKVRDKTANEQEWVVELLHNAWGGAALIVRGAAIDAASLPALVVPRIGLLTYQMSDHAVEIVSLNTIHPCQGIGSALLDGLVKRCKTWQIPEIIVMTTNDNLLALGFYQRRGFRLDALFVGTVAAARRIKPTIPTIAANGIAIRDEIRLHRRLGNA